MANDNEQRISNGIERSEDNTQAGQLARRGFLGVAGAAGLAGVLGGSAAADEHDGAHPNFADVDHDHSGEYGSPSRLGEAAPVESIAVEDLVTKGTPVVDVRAYGVVGDGETDDAEALQRAVDEATPHGVLYIPADLRVRLEDTVTINLDEGRDGEQNRFSFLCEGALTPAPGIGTAIHVVGGFAPYVFARVEGGGKDLEDSAFHVEGNRGGCFEGWAKDYAGRVFFFEGSATYTVGNLRTWDCGQSIHCLAASPMGEIRDVFDIRPTRAPEFDRTSDISINQYENFVDEDSEKGMVFNRCVSVWVDKIAVGGPMSAPQIEFHETINIHANSIFVNDGEDDGLVTDRIRRANMRVFARDNEVGLRHVVGSTIGANSIYLTARLNDSEGLLVEPHDGGTTPDSFHQFSGYVTNNGAPPRIETTDPHVRVHDFLSKFNEGSALEQLVVPDEENNVRVEDSWIQGIDGSPKAINHLGREARDAEVPEPLNWDVGDVVSFTDTEDGTGDGLYALATPDTWYRVSQDAIIVDVDPVTVLVTQPTNSGVPAWEFGRPGGLQESETFGQSFTVPEDFVEIKLNTANFNDPESAATVTLYEGTPTGGSLSEIARKRVDPWPNSELVLEFEGDAAGTYYLEMSDPEGTATWWIQKGGDDLADVGGTAFIDREPLEDANFQFWVSG